MIDRNAELPTFRSQLRSWLARNCPSGVRDPLLTEEQRYQGGCFPFLNDDHRLWFERCLKMGLVAPTLADAYGGGGYSTEQSAVIREEIQRIDAIAPCSGSGLTMVMPALIKYGNEDIKRRFLPRIASGECCWCQGFSEPGAGSDLASLKLRAEADGDDYILNGSKIWTSFAHLADWMFALVRTDTSHKQRGITFLLLDMNSPGIDVKPIRMISGNSVFNEVFFSDVRAPGANIVGEVNRGWDVAKYLMQHERDSVADFGFSGNTNLAEFAREAGLMPDGRITIPQLRCELAEDEINAWAFDCMLEYYAQRADAGQALGAHSSILKYCGSRLLANRSEMAVSLAGYEGTNWEPVPADKARKLASNWLLDKSAAILGGTSEIQLNIIARTILRLPAGAGG